MEAEIICSWSKLNVIKKDEIIIDLERSEYVKKRKEYLKKLKIPTISEVKDILGPDIARIIFLQCPSEQKVLLGLIPPLEGPGDTLWSSPSDLLIGKVCLKPPLTSKYMRALTHQGILEIGHEIEKKYWNQMELVKDCALGQQKADLLYNFEKELKKALVCLGVRLHEECNMKIAALTLQFEIQLAEMLRLQEEMLRAQFNAQLSELEDELKKQEEKCNKAIQEAVDRAVKEATKLFLNDLDKQHEILCEYFGAEIKRFEIQKNFELQMKHNKMVQIFKNIKHHLECRNMANMMYILCMERRKCVKEKCEIEDCYKKEINRLEEVVDKQTNDIKRLKTERHFKTQEVQLREKCIVEILAQFQKFINFALKASPTQAEFLLSLEKLMVFELAQSIEKTKVPKPKPEPPLQRWKKGKDDESEIRSLTVKDFHDCFNEVDPPLKFKEMDADTPLPAMYLNKHLYVREDFRDMIAAGVKISKHNELWSQDVEIVVKKMKEFAYEEPPADEEESEKETKPKKSALKTFKRTEPLNVNFDLSDKEIPLGEEDSVQMDESTTDVTECERKYKIAQPCRPMGISKISDMRKVTNFVDYAKIGEQDEKKTLISTKDSKDIYKTTLEHIYTGPMQDLTEESEICDITIESDDQFSMTDYLRWLQEGDDGENKRPMPMIKHKKKLGIWKTSSESISTVETPKICKEPVQKPVQDKVSIATKPTSKLAVTTKDSIIMEKVSTLVKGGKEVDMKKDSIDNAVYRTLTLSRSKLLDVRNSAELYREPYIKDTCLKCKCTSSIKLSKGRFSSVSFLKKDTLIPPDNLEFLYKEDKVVPPKKAPKKKKPCPPKPVDKCKVLGDRRAKEHIQEPQEFTSERIHSLINLIKDNPNLIRMFTSVTK